LFPEGHETVGAAVEVAMMVLLEAEDIDKVVVALLEAKNMDEVVVVELSFILEVVLARCEEVVDEAELFERPVVLERVVLLE